MGKLKPVLSPAEFRNLRRSQMIKEVNRIAERVNRQISRLKKSSLDYTQVIRPGDLKRMRILKPSSRKSMAELIQRYNELTRTKPDYTQKAVKKAIRQKEELQKLLKTKKLTAEQYRRYEGMVKYATSAAASFYQLMRLANDREIISDYELPEAVRENMDTQEATDWLLDRIMEDMEAKNKQRRMPADIEDATEIMEQAQEEGWKWAFEKSSGKRWRKTSAWGEDWYGPTPEEFAEIAKLFGK